MRSERKKPGLDNLKFVNDLAKMAVGAAGSFGDIRQQVKTLVREKVEQVMDEFDMVTRSEFDRVAKMAERAREKQEELEERLARYEGGGKKKKTAAKRKKK